MCLCDFVASLISSSEQLAAEDDELNFFRKKIAEGAHDATLECVLEAAAMLSTDDDSFNTKSSGLFGDRIPDIVARDLDGAIVDTGL